jgi:translation initiation factor eIF-2B subunit gamma
MQTKATGTNAEQAVILAGGGGGRVYYPVNAAGLPKVLMPVANRPLITFPLRALQDAGMLEALIVCEGDAASSSVRSWISQQPPSTMRVEVVRVQEGVGSVAALRYVIDRLRGDTFLLLSGDVVTEVPLRAMLLAHQLKGAALTALLGRRPSPAADTQPGKAPTGVDYVGIADGDRLAFYLHSPQVIRDLRLPATVLHCHPALTLTTRLLDMQVLVLNTTLIRCVLESRSDLLRLEEHLLPLLVQHQTVPPPEIAGALQGVSNSAMHSRNSSAFSLQASASHLSLTEEASLSANGAPTAGKPGQFLPKAPPEESLSLRNTSLSKGWQCAVYIAPEGVYCRRANTLQGWQEVNRDVVAPDIAQRLLGEAPSVRGENFIAPGVTLGVKTTVGSGCMCGEESSLGDKCSIKRSIVGRRCEIMSNVKVINSLLLDGVKVGDNCHIQNSIISEGCVLQPGAQIKDCQLGPGYVVPANADIRGEILPDT